ncbi:MAG: hypothetical protein Q9Q40_12460 [Acidobacteriota bacterium]|nr:hypothetical protein [Acidobacteriota bacterium]MDQ7087265.1 hypothetical protein [Acidobacteriota bacterium]
MLTTAPSSALCPTPEPLSAPEAENDPYYAQLCGLAIPGGDEVLPCPATDTPPQVTGPIRAQQVTLMSSVLSEGLTSAHAIWWEAAQVLGSGAYDILWRHRSIDGMPQGGWRPSTAVSFGASGLSDASTDHVYRVAFEDANGDKTCWSRWSSPQATAAFLPNPKPLTAVPQQVEDTFERQPTSPRPGDGLGPEDAWKVMGQLHRIAEDAGGIRYALFPQGSTASWGREATDTHVFTQAEFRTLSTAQKPNPLGTSGRPKNWRVSVQARDLTAPDVCGGTTLAAYAYVVQARHGPTWDDDEDFEPELRIIRAGPSGCSEGEKELLPFQKVMVKCPAVDRTGLKNGGQVLLRIEVEENDDSQTTIHALLAWDCDGSSCASSCEWRDILDPDVQLGHPLYNSSGRHGVNVNHWDHRIDAVRAGSGPQ